MKKVLLVNKFYYPYGGDCVYNINLELLLKERGHDVAVFAIESSKNLPSDWSAYFPSEVSYSSKNKNSLLETILRPLGSGEVKTKFEKLLDDFQPDIVHLSNIHTHLSPVIAQIASKRGIKVVWTLHDYKLLCPRSDSLRQGKVICEKCYNSKTGVIRYRCTKGSLPASILAYLEALKWNRRKLESYTSGFICPSFFMKAKMMQGNFSNDKLKVLHNFIDIEKVKRDNYQKSDYYCYIGRVSVEKGIETLLKIAKMLPYTLKIIGDGPQLEYLKANYKQDNIEFLGHKSWNEIKTLLGSAKFLVVPSEWYENNPFVILESLCLGTPVLGSNIGGIPELIEENVNGLLFDHGNLDDLKSKIISLYNKVFSATEYESIAKSSCSIYSASVYYNELMNIYEETH